VPPTHSGGEVVFCPPSGGAHTGPPTYSEVEAVSCLSSGGVDTLPPSHSNSVNNLINLVVRSTSVTSSGAAVGTHPPLGELVTPPPSFSKTISVAEAVSCPPRVVADTVPPTHSVGEIVFCPPSGGAHTGPPT
jgi:hypothetical protein